MRAQQIAKSLRSARLKLGATQKEMAERVGVSPRLWAEVERGERPNVSLETALRMLKAVGVALRLDEVSARVPSAEEAMLARAAERRATWTGGRTRLGEDDEPRVDSLSVSERLGAVAMVSQLAYAFASKAPRATSRVAEPPPFASKPGKPGKSGKSGKSGKGRR
ncbi:MAG: helix-turn-helix transcriptional regulator [Gemmatimonadaceae bacterium]|nr:helix-turn-helix transcriptional regulator [Gemmatimonadaceae bacterium]